MAGLAVLSGCGAEPFEVDEGFFGAVAADEPRAALIMQDILVEGGRAADAAVAGYFALSVTVPSAAGLSATGACVIFDPSSKRYERLDFPTVASSAQAPAIALPLAPRAMFALHARYGRLRFERLISVAEQLARFGEPVSARLASDLRWIDTAKLVDRDLATVLTQPDGTPLQLGETMTRIDLGATYGRLRSAGIGDLYIGPTARGFVEAVRSVGFKIDPKRLREALPKWSAAPTFIHAHHAWSIAASNPAIGRRTSEALSALLDEGGWSANGSVEETLRIARTLSAGRQAAGRRIRPDVPGATSFMVVDKAGQSVACALGMGQPFGVGRTAPGTGILLRPASNPGFTTAIGLVVGNTNTWQSQLTAAAGGGASALSALLQTVVTHFEGEAPVAAAIEARRSHLDSDSGTLYVEPEWTSAEQSGFSRFGAAVQPVPALGHVALFRCIEGIPREAQSCDLAGDRRGGGLVLFEKE